MVSRRVYKNPQSPFSIISKMKGLKDTELDARLVDVFAENMPLSLIDKPVTMSDGTIGVVREFDQRDPEYPKIEVNGRIIKTSHRLYCTSMYLKE
jgi:HD-GYP domain-containing protein (c-di-GMP phosphodiesterase class II)